MHQHVVCSYGKLWMQLTRQQNWTRFVRKEFLYVAIAVTPKSGSPDYQNSVLFIRVNLCGAYTRQWVGYVCHSASVAAGAHVTVSTWWTLSCMKHLCSCYIYVGWCGRSDPVYLFGSGSGSQQLNAATCTEYIQPFPFSPTFLSYSLCYIYVYTPATLLWSIRKSCVSLCVSVGSSMRALKSWCPSKPMILFLLLWMLCSCAKLLSQW